MAGVFLPRTTWYILHTFFGYQGYESRKNCKPSSCRTNGKYCLGILGIKTLAGAPQKIGGSPLFPMKGGPRPPFCTLHPPFEKKGIPAEFFKKRVPANS
jgi:hypothetical protein